MTTDTPPSTTSAGSKRQRLIFTCTCIVASSLTAGSIFTFPLWGPSITKALGLNGTQTNSLAVGAIIGEYVTAALWGNVADRYGPRTSSLGAGILFALGYTLMAISLYRIEHASALPAFFDTALSPPLTNFFRSLIPPSWLYLAAYYALAGSATAGSYFSAVVTSTKNFPNHSGLAIGLPCAIFGLSPLFLSQVATKWFKTAGGEVDVVGFLTFLAIVLGLINLLGWWGLRVPTEVMVEEERSSGAEETDPLLENRKVLEISPELSFKQFLLQPNFWILGLVVLLLIGPGEMVLASLGSIAQTLLPPLITLDSSEALEIRQFQLELFSFFNTLGRLLIGIFSDLCTVSLKEIELGTYYNNTLERRSKGKISRWSIMIWTSVGMVSSWIFTSIWVVDTDRLWVLSVITGLGYGIIFTLSPSLVAGIWGTKNFGRNWGLISYFSAIGAFIFTLLYGYLNDLNTVPGSKYCQGLNCLKSAFLFSAVGGLIGIALLVYLSRRGGRYAIV